MNPRPFPRSASYDQSIQGLLTLHFLGLAGKNDGSEADAVRDGLEGPWQALSELEKQRITGLSEDLESISEPTTDAPRLMNPQIQARLNEAIAARTQGEWDRALELLRSCRAFLAPGYLSYLRGTVWFEAGAPEVARVFFDHAVTRVAV